MTVINVKVPWHFWVVCVVSALWNLFGAYDYVMSVTSNADYLANFSPEMVELMRGFPAWATALWAIGVWASVAGSLLLFLRSRFAALAFIVSFLGAVISFGYQWSLDIPAVLQTPIFYGMPIGIVIAIIAQWWYAKRMIQVGVLK